MKLNKIMLAMVVMSISGSALAHGYIETPPSRNFLCSEMGKNMNKDCGAVQYEPQSSGETADGFPEQGPEDGKLASGTNYLSVNLNQQTATRWHKVKMQSGPQDFKWTFLAAHPITDFKYYMTKQDWNPNQPLTRDSFDLTPFCVIPGGPASTTSSTTHECDVPERTGYQVIYGAWDVSDTPGTFYQMIDAEFGSASGEVVVSEWATNVGSIQPREDLSAGDIVKLRMFDKRGERSDLAVEIAIADAKEGKKNNWAYALATKVNNTHKDLRAGNKNASGKVVATHGANTVYTNANSEVVRVETQIEKAPVDAATGVQTSFSANGMKKEYQMAAGALTIHFNLEVTGKMELTAEVIAPDNSHKAYEDITLEDSSKHISMAMTNLKAGKHTLVIIGTDAQGKSQQQSFDFMVKGEVEAVKPEVKPEVDGADKQCSAPAWSKQSSYNANDTVTHNGRIYMSKWWVDGNSVPGDAAVTDTTGDSTGWGLVWEDKGAC
ncbi:acetylglucosamine-binding protein [Yersinia ruckeri]|uniref:N-acetylglucosamine-binding protein GbpA n=1 Tax=Yersinia ruckeri TaxID=29486 RepID=UPI0004E3BBB7|nr:N-acetylglucosamine-binding protein GbpA [Yersinia ruckeri]ARZ02125.1 N-acetylglucosamine-binding protein A [Yersinia ruckeri]KFE37938.1 acetylglucosamine-binding protein [Yersinia ruckeri]OIX36488.1 acetylglucosamine-binding protein [Yersinia ruckeri]OIX37869.1 acetylglucosamine-binding protein [Yersinia ruckeri]OIX37973.1 acetylglucosamine-binding protein [Yersinia ruckeri]